MHGNLLKTLKTLLYLFALLNILIFLIVFNFSNLEALHHSKNLVWVDVGITSQLWAYSFVLSFLILLANIFYDLKGLSANERFHDGLRIALLILAGLFLLGMAFIIPFHEQISINKSGNYVNVQRHFVFRDILKNDIKFDDIRFIKYTIQYYYVRNPKVQGYVSAVSLVLTNGREIYLSTSTQDINSISLRHKLAQELALATGKQIEVVLQQAE